MSQLFLSPVSPSVSIHSGRPATTSLEVAKFFGKRHDSVLRDIRNLIDNCPEEFTAHNFVVSEYTDETGRTLTMFILYRDGFMLLVMGYTGKKAMAMKIAYIEAFNAMEAALAASAQPHPLSTVSSRKPLEKLVKVWAARSGIPHAQCWTMLDSHFCLADINDLPAEKIPEAIAWVQTRIDALPMVPAKLTQPPAAQKALPAGHRFDEEEFLAFAEECRQAHAEIWNIRERITDRASTLHTELMGYLVFREPACTPDRGVALELNKGYWRSVYRMCWEFLTSASQHVDDYNNPALYMLKLAKHMNAEGCAER